MFRRSLAAVLLCPLFICELTAQQTIHFQTGSFDEILHQAGREKKPVMLYFTGTGCSLCVEMERNVFTRPEVYKSYNTSYLSYESFDDSRKPDSATKRLRRHYGIVSNPSFIIVDQNGQVIHKAIGYRDATAFAAVAKEGLTSDNYRSWKKAIDNGNYSPVIVSRFLAAEAKPAIFLDNSYSCNAQTVLDNYFKTIPVTAYTDAFNWNIINKYVANPASDIFLYLSEHKDAFIDKYGEQPVTKKIYTVYYDAWSGNTGNDRYKNIDRALRQSQNPIAKLVVRIKEMYLASEAIPKNTGEGWDTFIANNSALIDQYQYLIAPRKYYYWSSGICDSKQPSRNAIETANHWMKRLLSIPGEENDYDYYATYANTFYLLGNKQQALACQKKAIDMAIRQHADEEEIAAFKKAIALYR